MIEVASLVGFLALLVGEKTSLIGFAVMRG